MILHTEQLAPTMRLNMDSGKNNMFFRVRNPSSHDEEVNWLRVSEPMDEPSALNVIRFQDDYIVIAAILAGTIHNDFGLGPNSVFSLFAEKEDLSWDLVARCTCPLEAQADAVEPAKVEEDGDGY